MNAGDRVQIGDFLTNLEELQKLGKNVDTVLQIVSDNLPDEERETIFRLQRMVGAHLSGGEVVLSA